METHPFFTAIVDRLTSNLQLSSSRSATTSSSSSDTTTSSSLTTSLSSNTDSKQPIIALVPPSLSSSSSSLSSSLSGAPTAFELRRRIDTLVYRFDLKPRTNIDGFLGYVRSDRSDLWMIRCPRRGWITVDPTDSNIVTGRPWNAIYIHEQLMDRPPQGVWISHKGDKSYAYDLVYVDPSTPLPPPPVVSSAPCATPSPALPVQPPVTVTVTVTEPTIIVTHAVATEARDDNNEMKVAATTMSTRQAKEEKREKLLMLKNRLSLEIPKGQTRVTTTKPAPPLPGAPPNNNNATATAADTAEIAIPTTPRPVHDEPPATSSSPISSSSSTKGTSIPSSTLIELMCYVIGPFSASHAVRTC
jgi:hypothetical protein